MAQKKTPTRRVPEEKAASIDEVLAAIEALTPAESTRLLKFAQRRIAAMGRKSKGRSGHGLLQEAITSVLEDGRRWNKETVSFVGFLFGAIRSISYNWCRAFDPDEAYLECELSEENEDGVVMNPLLHASSPNPDPEGSVILKEEAEHRINRVQRIKELIASRTVASLIIEAQLEGMGGPEIREGLGISQKEYETEMKWVYRTVRADAVKRGNHA
jgi:DNA-directed RNA polymerase specialized sigma24 family protein